MNVSILIRDLDCSVSVNGFQWRPHTLQPTKVWSAHTGCMEREKQLLEHALKPGHIQTDRCPHPRLSGA